jgi:hypothetical protein
LRKTIDLLCHHEKHDDKTTHNKSNQDKNTSHTTLQKRYQLTSIFLEAHRVLYGKASKSFQPHDQKNHLILIIDSSSSSHLERMKNIWVIRKLKLWLETNEFVQKLNSYTSEDKEPKSIL